MTDTARFVFVISVEQGHEATWAIVDDVLHAFGLASTARGVAASSDGPLILTKHVEGEAQDILRELTVSVDRRSLIFGTKTGRIFTADISEANDALTFEEPFRYANESKLAVRALLEVPTGIGPLLLIGREGGFIDFVGPSTDNTVINAMTVEAELSSGDNENYNRGHQITLIAMVEPDLVAIASTRARTFLFRPSQIQDPRTVADLIREAHAAAPPLAPGSPRDLRSVFRCESSDGKRTVICVSRGGVVQPAWIDASCVLRLHDGDRGGMDLGVGYISQLDLLCRGNVPRGENPLRITLTTENGLLLGRVGDGVTWEEFPIDSLAVGSLCREADRWMALSSIDGQTSIFLVDQNPAPTVRRNIGALMVGLRERAPLLALEWIPAPWGERDSPILRMVSMAGDNSVTVREFRVHNEQADVAPDASLLALSDEIEEAACSLDVHRFENVLRRLDERDVVARFENAAHADEGSDPSMLRAIGVRQLACVLAGAIIVFPEEDRTNLLRIALDFLARLRAYAAAAPVRFEVRRELVGRINQAIRLARKRVLFANEASIGPFRSWSAYLKKDNWRTEEMLEVAYYASRRFMTECPPGFSVSAHIHDRRGGVLDDAKSWSGRSWPSRPGKFAVETHQDGGNSTHNFPIRELLRTGEEVTESATTRFYEDPTDFLGVIYGTSHGRVRWFPPSPLVRGSEPSDLTEEETAESVGIAIGDLGSAIRWIYLYPVEQRKDAIIVVAASDHGQIGCWWATYETRRRLHTQALWYSFEENGIVGLDRGRVQGQDCLVIVNRIGDIVLFDQGCLDDSPLSLPGRRVDRLRTGFRPDAMALVPSSVDDDGSAVELKLEGDVRVRVQPLLCRGSAERMEKLPKIAAKLLQSLAARVPSRLRETVAEVGRVASTRALLVKLCFWLADVDAEDKSTLAPVDRSRVQISDVPYALQGVLRAARELAALSDRSDPTAVNARLRSAGELFFRLGDREALESLLESALISLNERLVLQGQLAAANSVFDSLMQMCNDLHVGRSRRLTLRFIKTVIDGHSLLELLKATSSDDSLRRERAQDLLGKRARLINSALLDPDSVLTLEATRAATGALFECALRLDKEGLIIDDVDVFDGFLDTAFRLSSGIQENRGHRGILRRELARAFALTTRICRRRIMACGIKCDLRDFDIDFRLAIADEMSTLRLIGLGLEEDEIRLFRASAGIRQEDDDKPYLLKPEMIADLGGDTWPEPERTGLLSWRLVDSTLDWLQGLERVLYDEPRRLGLQISSVGALAGNFTEFIARESAIGDPFRRTNRFLERALKDFDRRIREWQDGAELRQDELPRILRFVVEEIVTWARQWRNRLSEESRTRRGSGIRSPITERISDGFLRIEKAAEWCPRGAAVQREVLLTYLNHGAVESVHESSLALYELGAFIARHSEDYEPQMRERLFDRKERHKALNERDGSTLDPDLDAVMRMIAVNDHVPDSMRDLRTMLVYLRQEPSADGGRVRLRTWLEGTDRFGDCEFVEKEQAFVSRALLSYVRMVVAEFSRNNRRYGLTGDQKVRVELANHSVVLESKFDASDERVLERVQLLCLHNGLRRLPPDPRRPRRSHGLGIHLVKLVGVATGWEVDFSNRVLKDRGTLTMTLRLPRDQASDGHRENNDLKLPENRPAEGILVVDDSIVFAHQFANLLFALGEPPYKRSPVDATETSIEYWESRGPQKRFMVHLNPGLHKDPRQALLAVAERFGRANTWVDLRVLVDAHIPVGPGMEEIRRAFDDAEVKEAFFARFMQVSAYDDPLPHGIHRPIEGSADNAAVPKDIALIQRLRRELFGHELQSARPPEVEHDLISMA